MHRIAAKQHEDSFFLQKKRESKCNYEVDSPRKCCLCSVCLCSWLPTLRCQVPSCWSAKSSSKTRKFTRCNVSVVYTRFVTADRKHESRSRFRLADAMCFVCFLFDVVLRRSLAWKSFVFAAKFMQKECRESEWVLLLNGTSAHGRPFRAIRAKLHYTDTAGSGSAMWQICRRIVVSSSFDGVRSRYRTAEAPHLDMSRCWDVAKFCPLVVSVAGVRVVEFGSNGVT